MSKKNEATEGQARYGPTRNYTRLPNRVVDKWGRYIVLTLGSTHAWVLTVVIRLTIGYGQQSREVSAPALARLTGLSRARVCEVLEDLEAVGVITRERRSGRPTKLGVVLEWQPTYEALEEGKRLRQERSKRKHPDEKDANPSTEVDTLENDDPSTPADAYPSTGADGLPVYRGGHPHPSTPVDTIKESTCIETISIEYDDMSENGESLPKKESLEDETGSPKDSFFEEKERKTPPSSSSKENPSGHINPGDKLNSVKTDDDEKTKSSKNLNEDRDNDTRRNELPPSERTSSKESVKSLADEIDALSEESVTGEAEELAEKVREKISRIERSKTRRLAKVCVDTGNVGKLGDLVGRCEEKLAGAEVGNAYMYLVSSLYPLEVNSPDEMPLEAFNEAYEVARPGPTLGGRGRRHQFEGVASIHPRKTEAYFEEF